MKHTILVREVVEKKLEIDADSMDKAFNKARDLYSKLQPNPDLDEVLKSITLVSSDGRKTHTINY